MRRGLALLLALFIAAVAAAGARGAAPTVTAVVQPERPLFADPFEYAIVATTPADADDVRITDDVGPFARVAPTRKSRSVSNGVAATTVTETLACLSVKCVSTSPDGRLLALPRARAVVDGTIVAAIPVSVRVGTRVPAPEVSAPEPPFTRPHELPAVGYRVSPAALEAALLVTGIVLLVVAALGVVVPFLRGRRKSARAAAVPDPVARAVRLLRESAGRAAPDRRRAAALASRVVERPDLSRDAATIAWSRPEPGPPDAVSLADRVEHEMEAPA
jgi:hypothetical protein